MRHQSRLQDRLRHATASGLQVLDELRHEVFCRPEQSLYLWARFPGIDDANVLTRQCLEQGLMLAPCAIFSTQPKSLSPWTRLNVAYLNDPLFSQSIRQITQGKKDSGA